MGFVGNNLQISDDCKSYSVKKKNSNCKVKCFRKSQAWDQVVFISRSYAGCCKCAFRTHQW